MKVVIADDQKLLRDCLKHAIESFSDYKVIASAENGEEAVELCMQCHPDLILMDIQMPVCTGIEAARRIKLTDDNIKILMLTTSNEGNDVETAVQNGADGYVLKSISTEELIHAMKGVVLGYDIIHKDVYKTANKVADAILEKGKVAEIKLEDVNVTLSERDIRIISLIAEGMDTQSIAKELFLTEGRVRNIITEIISKLSLKDRAQLVSFAYKNNLIKI